MKTKVACLLGLLLLFSSCGGDGGGDNTVNTDNRSTDRDHHGGSNCTTTTAYEDWEVFVTKVREGQFTGSGEFSVTFREYTIAEKDQNCKVKWGFLHYCDGTSYRGRVINNRQVTRSSNYNHTELVTLVTPRPSNFQGRKCDGEILQAAIAIPGNNGDSDDIYQFDLEVPMAVNPVFEFIWQDGRRKHITTRTYMNSQ